MLVSSHRRMRGSRSAMDQQRGRLRPEGIEMFRAGFSVRLILVGLVSVLMTTGDALADRHGRGGGGGGGGGNGGGRSWSGGGGGGGSSMSRSFSGGGGGGGSSMSRS